ncbi:PilX N-terminal domain-containing pilus assembly protein [Marinospirillum sp. MEB164]|uniref:PilX N-terminal domain-containing pilus assembly protein n=1 Tax=Marinospirillum alkalitolerans TaxID=3123374 RepID=A0ABW8PUD2_9GAMM
MSVKKSQQGYALIMVLFILVAVTLFGLTSVQDASLQLQMSQNQQDYQRAFQAAEAALRYGERLVAESRSSYTASPDLPDVHAWPVTNAWAIKVGLKLSDVNSDDNCDVNSDEKNDFLLKCAPRVVISQPTLRVLGSNATGSFCERLYPITSFAVGEQIETRVVLRAYYAIIDDCFIE